MAEYIDPPISADYDEVVAKAVDELVNRVDGWVPRESDLVMWLIEVAARMNVETSDLAARVPRLIFKYFASSLLGILPIDAAPARVQTTWTLRDSDGHTIRAGTAVIFNRTGDEQLFFEVEQDVVVPPGLNSTTTGEVTLVSFERSSGPNGIPSGSTFTLFDPLVWANTITSTSVSSGGVDAEAETAYLNRLTNELRLLAPRPILPDEFAVLAGRIAGVGRALAIDNYNPTTGQYGQERMVTVAVADANGQPVAEGVRQTVAAYLDSMREVNFVVHVIDPSYADIDVSASVKVKAGQDAAVVRTRAIEALRAYLNPANWNWTKTVRRNELISLLDQVEGVDYVINITTPSGDVTLPGAAPLPRARTLNVSAS